MQDVYNSLPINAALDEIRTVEIKPGFGNGNVVCELRNNSLPQPGTNVKEGTSQLPEADYVALSYMWAYGTTSFLPLALGKMLEKPRIRCNNFSLEVTPILYAALRQLRHKDKCIVLWVDAICINQESRTEKTGQLKLVRKIYTLAEKTVVWLG